MEGGNFFAIKTVDEVALLTGASVRGSNIATIDFLARISPEEVRIIAVPKADYIGIWKTDATHLDFVFTYLGFISGSR
jgi:arginine deiminase